MDILYYKFYFEIINNKYTQKNKKLIFFLEILFCLLEFRLDDAGGRLLIGRL